VGGVAERGRPMSAAPDLNPKLARWTAPEVPKELRGMQLWHSLGLGPQLQNADELKRPVTRVEGSIQLLSEWSTRPLATEGDNKLQHLMKLNPSLRLGAIPSAPPGTPEYGVIDFDGEDAEYTRRGKEIVERKVGRKLCWRVRDGTKGQMAIFRAIGGAGSLGKLGIKDRRPKPRDRKGNGVDILLRGSQVVLDGAVLDRYANNELRRYRWPDGYPLASERPEVGPHLLAEIVDELREAAIECGWKLDEAEPIGMAASKPVERLSRELLNRHQYLNQLALDNIAKWAPDLFPGGAESADGYAIWPEAMGRDGICEERLSIHRNGIQDFGQEWEKRVGYTPIALIQAFFRKEADGSFVLVDEFDDKGAPIGGTVTEEEAVAHLCERLEVDWEAEIAKDRELADQAVQDLGNTPLTAADIEVMAKYGGGDPRGTPFFPHAVDTATAKRIALQFSDELERWGEAADFVEDFLCDEQVSVLYGESNIGKTFIALDLALHVSLGWSWHGRQVDRGGVVYIAGEGAIGAKRRYAAFREHYGREKTGGGLDRSGPPRSRFPRRGQYCWPDFRDQ
jgi:hypothetical protein